MSPTDSLEPIFGIQTEHTQNKLIELLFERMPMGICLLDPEYHIVRYNPTWAEYAQKYSPASAPPLAPNIFYFDLFPGAEDSTLDKFEAALQGKTIRGDGLRFETKDSVSYWDVVITPLMTGEKVLGILNVTTDATERILLQQHLEKRIEERTLEIERRRKVAESMRDIIRMINTNMPLEQFLDEAVVLAAEQMGASGCVLHEFNIDDQTLYYRACYGMKGITEKNTVRQFADFKATGTDGYYQATLQRKPTFGNYTRFKDRGISLIKNDPTIPDHIKARRIKSHERFSAVLTVPLFIQDRPWGGMIFYYSDPQEFSQEQIDIGMTFADQVAIAIENTRLMQEAEKVAVSEERNRLSRDLHDAVTQTLFSSSLIADVLPRIWERNPEEGKRRLEELRQLTRGALSEMRTLLVELRPAAMEDTNLKDLIGHLVNAFIAKSRIQVEYIHDHAAENPPVQVKEMFYRIAQETFNNINKHAHATQVTVELTSKSDETVLIIRDNGVGFNLSNPEHIGFGLKIMRERAQSVGAHFSIQSSIGSGTITIVSWNKAVQSLS